MPVAPQSQDPFSTRHVKFINLYFSTSGRAVPVELAYMQTYVRVIIDSCHEITRVVESRPQGTTAFGTQEKQLAATKIGQTRGAAIALNTGANPTATITAAVTKINEKTMGYEKTRNTSGITEQHQCGVVEWGFEVDDPRHQKDGIRISNDDLPMACFEFPGDPKDPPTPPERMDIGIISYWSIILPSGPKNNWWRRLLNFSRSSGNTAAVSYSNLCQITAFNICPSDLPPRSDYMARMHVTPGVSDAENIRYSPEVRLQTTGSVTFRTDFTAGMFITLLTRGLDSDDTNISDDCQDLTTFELPMHKKLRLFDNCRKTMENLERDSKSH